MSVRTFHTGSMHNVTVRVTVLPGVTLVGVQKNPGSPFYRPPSAATLRNMVDATLAVTGRKRNGARAQTKHDNGWVFAYPTT